MVILYTTPTCAPCKVAKKRLAQADVPHEVVDLTMEPARLADLKHRLGDVSFVQTPLIEFNGVLHDMTKLRDIIIAHA